MNRHTCFETRLPLLLRIEGTLPIGYHDTGFPITRLIAVATSGERLHIVTTHLVLHSFRRIVQEICL
jgi:hypothetical protein